MRAAPRNFNFTPHLPADRPAGHPCRGRHPLHGTDRFRALRSPFTGPSGAGSEDELEIPVSNPFLSELPDRITHLTVAVKRKIPRPASRPYRLPTDGSPSVSRLLTLPLFLAMVCHSHGVRSWRRYILRGNAPLSYRLGDNHPALVIVFFPRRPGNRIPGKNAGTYAPGRRPEQGGGA